jgi:hypothetical protein
MAQTEERLGSRDSSKKIYLPTFGPNGPRLINTPSFDGAFAELSQNAAKYWPAALYELAHETVHLLNPIAGSTNWLEEGIAVALSIELSRIFTNDPMTPPTNSIYQEAWQLITALPIRYDELGSLVRAERGQLNLATSDVLKTLMPHVHDSTIMKLRETCVTQK